LRAGAIGVRVVGDVAEPVGKFIADKLGVSFEPIIFPTSGAYAQSFGKAEWDIALGSRVFATADKSDLISDVWVIDLIYVAASGDAFPEGSQVDRPGVKVGVVQDSPFKIVLRTGT
jgi:polar amino acid transport system substrate-binding protein